MKSTSQNLPQVLGLPGSSDAAKQIVMAVGVSPPDLVETAAKVQRASRTSIASMPPAIVRNLSDHEGKVREEAMRRSGQVLERMQQTLPSVKTGLIEGAGLERTADDIGAGAASLRDAAGHASIESVNAAEAASARVQRAQAEAQQIIRKRWFWGLFAVPVGRGRRAVSRLIDAVAAALPRVRDRAIALEARGLLEACASRLESERPAMLAQVERLRSIETEAEQVLAAPSPSPVVGELHPNGEIIVKRAESALGRHEPGSRRRIAESLARGDLGTVVEAESERILAAEYIVPNSVAEAWSAAGIEPTTAAARMYRRALELGVKNPLTAPGRRVRRGVTVKAYGASAPGHVVVAALERITAGEARVIPVEGDDPQRVEVSVEETGLAATEIREIEKALERVRRDPDALRPLLLLTDSPEAVLRAFGGGSYASESLASLMVAGGIQRDAKGGWWRLANGRHVGQGTNEVLAALEAPGPDLASACRSADEFMRRAGAEEIALRTESMLRCAARADWMPGSVRDALERLHDEAARPVPLSNAMSRNGAKPHVRTRVEPNVNGVVDLHMRNGVSVVGNGRLSEESAP